jgi:hypothetical protein
LVIGVPDARPEPRLFEIGAGVNEHDDVSADFGWSSSGRAIYAGESIINLDEGSVCHVLGRVQLVADDLGVADDRTPWDWAALASRLRLFNAQCQATGAWEVPGKWAIVDVSPDRGLLSVAKIVGFPNKAEDLIADPLARRIVQRWSGARQPGGQFADRGRAICSGSDAGAADRAPVTCWEADSGKKIGEAPTINGGDPIAPALHVGRVVASDYRRRKTPFSYEYTEIFKRRVLWDFRAGREVVSWRPRFQTWDFQLDPDPSKPSKHVDEPFRFALSPDGEYVAEGGNGRVYLYKVEP